MFSPIAPEKFDDFIVFRNFQDTKTVYVNEVRNVTTKGCWHPFQCITKKSGFSHRCEKKKYDHLQSNLSQIGLYLTAQE